MKIQGQVLMASPQLLDPIQARGISETASRRVCSHCRKTYHKNSLTRHKKTCAARNTVSTHAVYQSCDSGSGDEGPPPKLRLFGNDDDATWRIVEGECVSSADECGGSAPPKLQSVTESVTETFFVTNGENLKLRNTSGCRKAKWRAEIRLRRNSLDRLGILDTPSEHSESNESIKLQIGSSGDCSIERSPKLPMQPATLTTRFESDIRQQGETVSGSRETYSKRPVSNRQTLPECLTSMRGAQEIYKCRHCRQDFRLQSDMISHGLKHIEQGILVCLLCSNKVIQSLDSHFRSNHLVDKKKIPCAICQKLVDRNNFVAHLKEHHSIVKKFRCDQCNKEFSFLQNLLYHKGTDHLKEFRFSKYCQRNGDMMKASGVSEGKSEEEAQPSRKYTNNTSYCRRSNGSTRPARNPLISAMETDGDSLQPSDCKFATAVDSDSLRRRRFSCSSLPYPNCSVHCSAPWLCSLLKKAVSPNANPEKLEDASKCYTCKVCNKSWETRISYLHHLRDDHHWTRDKLLNSEYEPDIWCPECGQEFVVKPTLLKHLVIAHNDISCPDLYMETVGYGRRPLLSHQCSVCLSVFESNTELVSHLRCHGLAYLAYLSKTSCRC